MSHSVPTIMGVAKAYRLDGRVTLSFFGNAHGMQPGEAFTLLDAYGSPGDRALFSPGQKVVSSVLFVDTLTYLEPGPDGNADGSLRISR